MPVSRVRAYQRRRKGPVIAVVSVLAVLAAVTWTAVLLNAAGASGARSCPPPATGPPPGEVLAADALDEVAPAPPGAVRVRVLNAGGQRGQANLVAAQLGDLGFTEAAPPDNDTVYPDGDMDCAGQLRFGAAGQAAASTLALVLPCTELLRDTRADDTVDVVVGTAFGDVNPVRAARDALDQLADPGAGSDGSANTGEADPDAGPAPPPAVDPAVLAAARDVTC
jgi:hypothetical protein